MGDDKFFSPKRPQGTVSDGYVDDVKIRDLSTLRPLEPATIPCLSCEKPFDSFDRILNRICPRCSVEAHEHDTVFIDDLSEDEFMNLLDSELLDGEDV